MIERQAVASPCTGVCRMDAATGWCVGCRRTIDEIVAWATARRRGQVAGQGEDSRSDAQLASPTDRRDRMKTHRFLVRPDFALRLAGLRASAAGTRRSVVQRRLPAGAVRRAAAGLGPEGPGRDRAETGLDVSPDCLACAPAGRGDRHAGRASVQSAGAAALAAGLRAAPVAGRTAMPVSRFCAMSGSVAQTPTSRSGWRRCMPHWRRCAIRLPTTSSSN